ncbi:MAG: polymerase [Treponema sp.]|jgi:hypothetical protein|nr:polymerase [Treponema sp.]
MRKITVFIAVLFAAQAVFGQVNTSISGSVEWDAMRLNARISLNMASAGLKLPAGRTQGEALLYDNYLALIRSSILGLRVDSSSTIADLVDRGELSLADVEAIAFGANSVPPALSPDMRNIISSYTISLSSTASALLRHDRAFPIIRTLSPVSTATYTGIIIIAAENLPVHGMRGTALPVPCLFPKIWDSEMNLVYERSMLEARDTAMVHYFAMENIFAKNPSGISAELQQIVGDRPLRIFASGVFGITPTDLIIDRSYALLIISSQENRRLLSQGRVAFILDDSTLRYEFNGE